MTDPQVARLSQLLAKHNGDAAAAVREFTGGSIGDLARRVELPQSNVGQCLSGAEGRKYGHVRRAIEAEIGLPPFALDKLLGP